MENLEALIAIQRGDVLDQDTLSRLVGSKLVDVVTTQSPGRELMFVGFTPEGYRMLEQNKALLVSDLERRILNLVVRGFLDRHEPTSTRTLLQELRCSLSPALHRLSNRGILQVANNTYLNETYLPHAIAFYHCGDSAALAFARKSTEMVLRVLPILFNKELESPHGSNQRQFTATEVENEARAIGCSIEPNAIFTGLFLANDFSVFTGTGRDDKQVGIVTFSLGERVFETQYLDWDDQVRRSNIALVNEWDYANGKSGARAVGPGVPSARPPIDFERLLPQIDSDNTPVQEGMMHNLLVLISHSSKDEKLASTLIDFLRSGLGLLPKQIRCTSVDGYRLPAGVHTETQLREEVKSSKVLVGLITANSLASPYVMFELGARWGAGAVMIPLLAGVSGDQLRGPLSGMNALLCSSEEQLHQALGEIGSHLRLEVQSPAAYLKQLRVVAEQAGSVVAPNPSSLPVSKPKPKLVLSVGVTGIPPERQLLHVKANQPVKATRLEYLLSSGACVASDILSIDGESFDIPIEDTQVVKVWNTHRPDRNWSDHSGPAKLRLTLIMDGEENAYTIPVQMDSHYHANTAYRKLSGSESFRG